MGDGFVSQMVTVCVITLSSAGEAKLFELAAFDINQKCVVMNHATEQAETAPLLNCTVVIVGSNHGVNSVLTVLTEVCMIFPYPSKKIPEYCY